MQTVNVTNGTIPSFTYPFINSTIGNTASAVYNMPFIYWTRDQGMFAAYRTQYQIARQPPWSCINNAAGSFQNLFRNDPPDQQECIDELGGDTSTTFATIGTPAYWRWKTFTILALDALSFYYLFGWDPVATCTSLALPVSECNLENSKRVISDPDKMSVTHEWIYDMGSISGRNVKSYIVRGVPYVTMLYDGLSPMVCFSLDRNSFGADFGTTFEVVVPGSKWRISNERTLSGNPDQFRLIFPDYMTEITVNQTWTIWSETNLTLSWNQTSNCATSTGSVYTGWLKASAVYDSIFDGEFGTMSEVIDANELILEDALNVTVKNAELFVGSNVVEGSNALGYVWRTEGTNEEPLVCALPQHVDFGFEMNRVNVTNLRYFSLRGVMVCVRGCSWGMRLPVQDYGIYGPCDITQENVTEAIRDHAIITMNTIPGGSPNIFAVIDGQDEFYNWGKTVNRVGRFLLVNDQTPNTPIFFTPFNDSLPINFTNPDTGDVELSLFNLPLETFRILLTKMLTNIDGPVGFEETTNGNGFTPVIEELCFEERDGMVTCTSTGDSIFKSKLPIYDITWGALTTIYTMEDYRALYRGRIPPHFGGIFYNDVHFWDGYGINAFAQLGHFDQDWADRWKDSVECFIRNAMAPSKTDDSFPFLRNKDPFLWNSWANGAVPWADGRNQESVSEAANCYWGALSWARVTGNDELERWSSTLLAMETIAARYVWFFQGNDDVIPEYFSNNTMIANYNSLSQTYGTFFGDTMEEITGITRFVWSPFQFDMLDAEQGRDFQNVSDNVYSVESETSPALNPTGLPTNPLNVERLIRGQYPVFNISAEWVTHLYGLSATFQSGVSQAAFINNTIFDWDSTASENGGVDGNTQENMLWWSSTVYIPDTEDCISDFNGITPNKPTNTSLFISGSPSLDLGIIGELLFAYPTTDPVLAEMVVPNVTQPNLPPPGTNNNSTLSFESNTTYTGSGESSEFPEGLIYVFLEQTPPTFADGLILKMIVCYDYEDDGSCDYNITCDNVQPQAGEILVGVPQLARSDRTGPGEIFFDPCTTQGTKSLSESNVRIRFYTWIFAFPPASIGNNLGMWTSSRYQEGLVGYLVPYFDTFQMN